MCAKEVSDLNFYEAVIGKISTFQEIATNFIIHKNLNFSSIIEILLPYTFNGSSIRGILFFNFASCESLRY